MNNEELRKNCNAWIVHGGSIFTMLDEPFNVTSNKHWGPAKNVITTSTARSTSPLDFVGFSIVDEFGSTIGRDKVGLEEYISEIMIKEISIKEMLNQIELKLRCTEIITRLLIDNDAKCFQLIEPFKTADAWYYVVDKEKQHCIFVEYEDSWH